MPGRPLHCSPRAEVPVSAFPSNREGCGLKTDVRLCHTSVKKVTCAPHHTSFVCVRCRPHSITFHVLVTRRSGPPGSGSPPPGSVQPVCPRQPPQLLLFPAEPFTPPCRFLPSEHPPPPQMRREGSQEEGRGSQVGEARTRPPDAILTLLPAGGLPSKKSGPLARSVKPEPLKSEADGDGSPEGSAVGVGGLG